MISLGARRFIWKYPFFVSTIQVLFSRGADLISMSVPSTPPLFTTSMAPELMKTRESSVRVRLSTPNEASTETEFPLSFP